MEEGGDNPRQEVWFDSIQVGISAYRSTSGDVWYIRAK